MKILKFILIILLFILNTIGCDKLEQEKIYLFDNYFIYWDKSKLSINNSNKEYVNLKRNFAKNEIKLIECLKDTTKLFDVCFKDKPLRRGDVALACLIDLGSTHKLYHPEMGEVKRLDKNEICYFSYYNNFYHLEKNRLQYYNYIKNNKNVE